MDICIDNNNHFHSLQPQSLITAFVVGTVAAVAAVMALFVLLLAVFAVIFAVDGLLVELELWEGPVGEGALAAPRLHLLPPHPRLLALHNLNQGKEGKEGGTPLAEIAREAAAVTSLRLM